MYTEIGRVSRLHAERYWPLSAAIDQAWFARELRGAGWREDGGSFILPALNSRDELNLAIDPRAIAACPWQNAAAAAALAALPAAGIPLRESIRVSLASLLEKETIYLAPGCGRVEMAAEHGLLVAFAPEGEDGLVRIPCWTLLSRSREALRNMGFQPQLALRAGERRIGLGFMAPGRDGCGREEMARAIQAYTGLLYGLAGYGVMAFDFDLENS